MDEIMKIPKTMINLSGGIDSTYYTWRWLREHPNESLLIHHCIFNQRRKVVENDASKAICEWLKNNKLDRFQYVHTVMSKGNVRKKTLDIEMIAAVTAVDIGKEIDSILLPYCREETPIVRKYLANGGLDKMDLKHRTAMFMAVVNLMSRRKRKYICPYAEVSKAQMIQELPLDLLKLTWYCRNPNEGKPCGKCFNCRRVIPHINKKLPENDRIQNAAVSRSRNTRIARRGLSRPVPKR